MSELAKDLLSGWLSGIGQVLTMMPFENIKVKMVSRPSQYTGYTQCFLKSIREEGVLSFYKGMLSTLLGVGPQVSLQFATVETLKKYIKRHIETGKEEISIKYVALSGAVSGVPSAIIITPLDHVRFRVALEKSNSAQGSVRLMASIWRQYGLRKLYLGFHSCLAREIVMRCANFSSYEAAMRRLGSDKKDVKTLNVLLAAGFTGVLSWIVSYPFDFVKTIIQTESLSSNEHKSVMGHLRAELRRGSLKRVLTGIEIMAVRAFVVNSTAFMCFEMGKKHLYSPYQIIV